MNMGGNMKKRNFFPWNRLLSILLLILALVPISKGSFTSKINFFSICLGVSLSIIFAGLGQYYDDTGITNYYYFKKQYCNFSDAIVINKTKSIFNCVWLTFKYERISKNINYSTQVKICYFLQKKKMLEIINIIAHENPNCLYAIDDVFVSYELLLAAL